MFASGTRPLVGGVTFSMSQFTEEVELIWKLKLRRPKSKQDTTLSYIINNNIQIMIQFSSIQFTHNTLFCLGLCKSLRVPVEKHNVVLSMFILLFVVNVLFI